MHLFRAKKPLGRNDPHIISLLFLIFKLLESSKHIVVSARFHLRQGMRTVPSGLKFVLVFVDGSNGGLLACVLWDSFVH